MIDLYWQIGEHISQKISVDGWGEGTVEALAAYIQRRQPATTGFSASNVWRMRQFFETYRDTPKLAPLVRELSWTHNLLILNRDVRKPHEPPSTGVLLCATKDHESVEYALSRAMSPGLASEYQTRLPDKRLLQAKLHEFYELAQEQAAPPAIENRKPRSRQSNARRKERKK